MVLLWADFLWQYCTAGSTVQYCCVTVFCVLTRLKRVCSACILAVSRFCTEPRSSPHTRKNKGYIPLLHPRTKVETTSVPTH